MDRRTLVVASLAGAIPLAAQGRQASVDEPSTAGELLELYLTNVVNNGYRGYIDMLFDPEFIDLEAVWDYHEEELDSLAVLGRRPESTVDAMASEGDVAFAHGTRNDVEVFYLLRSAAGRITSLQLSTVQGSISFDS